VNELHGEYKVTDGKLVIVDLRVDDGQLAEVRVAGDFFLEPDAALESIDAALEGAPVTASRSELGARIRARLPVDANLIGFSPEDVGAAVRRALGHATDWHDHDWQVLHDEPREPAVQMALEQVLSDEVAAGRRPPTLRIWEWERPSVVIGSFQSLRNEVDDEAARRHGVTVVRRITGGGAMFNEPGNTITYSLYAPASLVDGMSFVESYEFLDQWVLAALAELGVQATYVPINDITSPEGKIGGAAQRRLASGAVLHHVMMAYDMDAQKMVEVLRIGRTKMSDKGTTSAVKRVDPVRSQTGLDRASVIESFLNSFSARYGATAGALTEPELTRAHELAASRFSAPEWIGRVP